jgi:hypothetical protein
MMATRGRADPIIAFNSGAEDSERRTLAEILEWDDDRLKTVHDYDSCRQAVTRMLSCRNSGATSAPLGHTSVWNSGWIENC